MTHTETLNILDELESLVSDQLQVVSYKWLSRNFSISSKTAKSLLKDFVEKNGKGFEVVYIVSGWLKNTPSDHRTRLVSSSKLSEVEKEFNGTHSVSIYSVQASIPMEPAAIWNSEFVQAEELFREPSAADNCLRDNRFCGISNSFVKRNIEGATANVTAPGTASVRTTVPSIPKVGYQAKNETVTTAPAQKQPAKSSNDKEKSLPVPATKKNGQAQKSVTGTGGSLKNMWGRVPVKAEDTSATIEVKNHDDSAQKPSHGAEHKGGSDDEAPDVSIRNRKRKVIFDFSDEECEDVISLASPSSPKINPGPDSEETKDSGPENPDKRVSGPDEPEVSGEDWQKTTSADTSGVKKEEKPIASSKEKMQGNGSEAGVNPSKGRMTNAPSSPKRKKVLKTRIDERGREVTEVVWEDTETNTKKKEDSDTSKKLNDGKSANAAVNRAVVQKKSPAMGAVNAGGKTGSKKGGNVKDPKQGNIMSFFKKKV
ncbi:DNA polymerase delta subunit 3 isoform X2 [Brassica napus]|uniref:DNA polymerase delta subunit 3 isoform X2 n=1 Tax=Brassica oleracea var. oleracea TaxID=109376 RepID=UPI0006A6D134|nr:PREDICTED: DNA polymerase delta subunit 3 isoform X2 [Brassica oleracea var. oleracea]XP_022560443.1 DNA polymerase delta subunit 3 isoform X2 [Brassica napus]